MLAETLAVGPCGDLALIANKNGQPFAKEAFGNAFKDACRAAGVPGSAHGLRKIAATRAANAGATVAQLEAIFGWSGGRMASLYNARCGSSTPCDRRYAQAGEQLAKFYCRTFAFKVSHLRRTQAKSTAFFVGGGR